jgi:hypothetical protein
MRRVNSSSSSSSSAGWCRMLLRLVGMQLCVWLAGLQDEEGQKQPQKHGWLTGR